MPVFKMLFFAGIVVLGGVAVFLGAIVIASSLHVGSLTLNYEVDGKPVVESISRAGDAARYWKLFSLMGVLPCILGIAAVWWGVRTLRG